MFWIFYILFMMWAIPTWLDACDELEDIREARRYGYDY